MKQLKLIFKADVEYKIYEHLKVMILFIYTLDLVIVEINTKSFILKLFEISLSMTISNQHSK
jgi:hypothetical protein